MQTKTPYRNALRSQKMIKMAFLKLLSKKEITKIKVKEIVELTDISKGTFYVHYRNIYGVWKDIEKENIDRMSVFLNTQSREDLLEDFSPLVLQIFFHIEENQNFYQMLFNSHMASSFSSKLQKVFIKHMMSDKKMLSKLKGELEAKMFFSFIAVGTASLIQEIFTNNIDLPFEDLVKTLCACITNGVSAIKK